MRDGEKRTQPRSADDLTGSVSERKSLDVCSTGPSKETRLRNLAAANGSRLARADVRRQLHAMTLDWDEFLDEVPECCAGATIGKVLTWLPNIGTRKARHIIGTLGTPDRFVSDGTRMDELTAADKYRLSAAVAFHLAQYARSMESNAFTRTAVAA